MSDDAAIDQHFPGADGDGRGVTGALATFSRGVDGGKKSGPGAASRVRRAEQKRHAALAARLKRDLVLDKGVAGQRQETKSAPDRARGKPDRNARARLPPVRHFNTFCSDAQGPGGIRQRFRAGECAQDLGCEFAAHRLHRIERRNFAWLAFAIWADIARCTLGEQAQRAWCLRLDGTPHGARVVGGKLQICRAQHGGARGVVHENGAHLLGVADGDYVDGRIERMRGRRRRIAPPHARAALCDLASIEGQIRASGGDGDFGGELGFARLTDRGNDLVLGRGEPGGAGVRRYRPRVRAGHAENRDRDTEFLAGLRRHAGGGE